jgi:hypothetical protein
MGWGYKSAKSYDVIVAWRIVMGVAIFNKPQHAFESADGSDIHCSTVGKRLKD